MARTLKSLIKASGNAGTTGQSFRNHVAGAATGAKMSDYNLTGWSFSAPPTNGATYTGNQNFGGNITFTQGSRATYIKRIGAVMVDPNAVGAVGGIGGSLTMTVNSIVGAATGSTYNVLLKPGYNGLSSSAAGNPGWFDGYTSPTAPADSNADNVTMFGSLNSPAAASGFQAVSWADVYIPDQLSALDSARYNPQLVASRSINMNNRAETTADWLWEWHSNSSYTSLVSASLTLTFTSLPNTTHVYYLRAQRILSYTAIWDSIGAVTFTDPRQTAPTLTPTSPTITAQSHQVTGGWTNTETADTIECAFESLSGATWSSEGSNIASAGSTSITHSVPFPGQYWQCRARYKNTGGVGPWTAYSSAVLTF